MFNYELFTIVNIWKWPKCPLIDEWIKKWYLSIYNGILTIKMKETMPSVKAWTDLESIMLMGSQRFGHDLVT